MDNLLGQETAASAADGLEVAEGSELRVEFNGKLCIHARFCVLQAPSVFKANTPGEWIYPDTMSGPDLAAVARNCPSGAIAYKAAEARLDERAPPVNLLRIRENGAYALNADLEVAGESAPATRRTLCRCGASQNKPYCDGSHNGIGFTASGEPPSIPSQPLDPRDGPLQVTPLRNGPLEVKGPLEIVSGTGRTVGKVTHALLCRCGGSTIKPFCDGTHALNGFNDCENVAERPALHPDGTSPTLAAYAGGREALLRLTQSFYAKVPQDPILAPVFAGMDQAHAEHVADFIAEVFGADPLYSDQGGSHIGMIAKHIGRKITEEQRSRWLTLMLETADEVGLPRDPAFRETFHSYLDWGSRLAVINSAEGIEAPTEDLPMPRWGWGPYASSPPDTAG